MLVRGETEAQPSAPRGAYSLSGWKAGFEFKANPSHLVNQERICKLEKILGLVANPTPRGSLRKRSPQGRQEHLCPIKAWNGTVCVNGTPLPMSALSTEQN